MSRPFREALAEFRARAVAAGLVNEAGDHEAECRLFVDDLPLEFMLDRDGADFSKLQLSAARYLAVVDDNRPKGVPK